MNILHVGYIGNRPHSGVATVVPKYLEHQARHAKVALLNFCDFLPPNAKDNYEVFHWKKGGLAEILQLEAPFNKPDLVVFHEVYRPRFIKAAKAFRKLGIPYIIIPHVSLTNTAQRHKRIKKTLGNWLFFNSLIRGALMIQYLSESEKEQSSKFNHLPHFIRNNGIDIKGRQKREFNTKRLRLIYVGRLEFEIKGIDRILEVARIIKEQMLRQDIHITLLGTASDSNRSKIQSTIAEHSLERVVSVGDGVFGADKIGHILDNDCFIQLSRTEGQPLGIIEAMDLGMPCIVTKGTTFYDIAKQHNAGIPVSDSPAEIAEVILDIRNGKYELPKISRNTSMYASKQFNWKTLGKDMVKDYKDIIGNRSSKGASQ